MTRLFASQDGLALTAQLAHLGLRRGIVRQRIAAGEWERFSPTLVGVAAVPPSWSRQALAALLETRGGAALSHTSAAHLHGFDGFDQDGPIHLTTLAGRHRTSLGGVVVHRSELLGDVDCTHVDGLFVVSRAVTLLQVAHLCGRDGCGRALDGVLRDGVSPAWIEQVARRWRRPGVPGPAVVLDLLHQRVDQRLPRSWFQRLAKRLLKRAGIEAVDEHPVRDGDGRLLAELDLAIPHLQIGVECQSWRWHSTPTARAADARRKRRLRMLGWELVEVWWSDLDRIDDVLAELRYLIDRRSPARLPGSGAHAPDPGKGRRSRAATGPRDAAGSATKPVSRRGGTGRAPSR